MKPSWESPNSGVAGLNGLWEQFEPQRHGNTEKTQS
jgi:hypothetical protein